MRVLIGYDGSDCAREAVDDVRLAGLPPDTEACVMTAADVWPGLLDADPPGAEVSPSAEIRRIIAQSRARAAAALAAAHETARAGADRVRALAPGWVVTDKAVPGSPDQALLSRAHGWNADLIVVGSHGRSLLGRLALGSVSQRVLHHAGCSVRIGRCRADGDAIAPSGAAARGARILLGVDGSVGAATAVSAVASRTWPAGSEARVVTAADPALAMMFVPGAELAIAAPHPPSVSGPDFDERGYYTKMLEAVARELRDAGLAVTTAVLDGEPKHALVHEAERWRADCIFVGASGLRGIERFLIGSVSAAVAARAHCSVEVIRA